MGKKLKKYILFLETLLASEDGIEDIESLKQSLLIEIGFWQHERLIHLLVTFLFAIVTVAVLLVSLFYLSLPLIILFFLLLCLLVPYINHYYTLENGTQKLYTIYEELLRREKSACIPDFDSIDLKQKKQTE